MKRSKVNDTEISKDQRLQQQDSDGSGSVISLQSSSSDDSRYAGVRGRDFYSAGTGLPMGEGDSPGENVAKLQQKLNMQPTHDTLDEIISTMKRQNGIKNSSNPGASLPLHNDSAVGGKTYNSSLGWNSSSLQMR